MSTLIKRGALLLTGALVVGVSACGSASSNGVATDTPTQAWTAMVTSLKAAKSLEITGQGTYSSFTGTIDAKIDVANSAADVTVGIQGGTVELWYASKQGYLEVNKTAITLLEQLVSGIGSDSLTPAQSSALSKLANQCVNLGATNNSSSPVGSIFGSVSGDTGQAEKAPSGLTAGAVKTVDGQSVLPLSFTETTSGETATGELDIATTGTAYPVALTVSSDGFKATVTFTNWNSVSSISAPSGCISYTAAEGDLGVSGI